MTTDNEGTRSPPAARFALQITPEATTEVVFTLQPFRRLDSVDVSSIRVHRL